MSGVEISHLHISSMSRHLSYLIRQSECSIDLTLPSLPIHSFTITANPSPSMISAVDRLLIVANRLPITVKQNGVRDYVFSPSSGGLVTGLSGLTQSTEFQWFGWPGVEVPRRCVKEMENRLAQECSAVPIWLSEKLCEHHYNGFSSTLLLLP